MDKNHMTDTELDALLQKANQPPLPRGFAERLQAKLEQPVSDNVLIFPAKPPRVEGVRWPWLSAIPLAASLAAGLYIGAQGLFADSLASFNTSPVSEVSDAMPDIGIEDTESFINGEL